MKKEKKMFKGFLAISVFVLLSGCHMFESREQKMNRYHNQCLTYGFEPGTDAFSACMQKADADEKRNSAIVASRPLYIPPPAPVYVWR